MVKDLSFSVVEPPYERQPEKRNDQDGGRADAVGVHAAFSRDPVLITRFFLPSFLARMADALFRRK